MGVLADPALEERLAALHAQSDTQAAGFGDFFRTRARQETDEAEAVEIRSYLADKLVALDKDKAEFCHLLIRAMGARRVVEAGTSFGVSTVYLASAVRANVERMGGEGAVIATEYEPEKAAHARGLFADSGLAPWIDLREGDLRETLKEIAHPVEFLLMDIWIPMVIPALRLITPHMGQGAVIVADNTTEVRTEYAPFFAFLDEASFQSVTLPFVGGLEMAVKV